MSYFAGIDPANTMATLKQEFSSFIQSLGAGTVSKEFFDFIKAISDAKSKQVLFKHMSEELVFNFLIQEEAFLISKEVHNLKGEIKKGIESRKDDDRVN